MEGENVTYLDFTDAEFISAGFDKTNCLLVTVCDQIVGNVFILAINENMARKIKSEVEKKNN